MVTWGKEMGLSVSEQKMFNSSKLGQSSANSTLCVAFVQTLSKLCRHCVCAGYLQYVRAKNVQELVKEKSLFDVNQHQNKRPVFPPSVQH